MRRLCLFVWLLLYPVLVTAQVLPPSGGGSTGTITLPVTECLNQVGIGLTSSGVLQCGPVLPAMAPGLVPSGGDVSTTGQVTATHLTAPLPLAQGGLGFTVGTSGGMPYFSSDTTLASSGVLPLGAPLFGGGPGNPPVPGTRSGTTPEVATIFGPHTLNKQLTFDANGNVIASPFDVGGTSGGPGGPVTSVFGRTGAVLGQVGDYVAAQVTNAADLTAPNLFAHASGQTMARLNLSGSVTGTLSLLAPQAAGASVIIFPPGSTDFMVTGGTGQVVQQFTAGGAFTVGRLSAANLTNGVTGSGSVVLQTNPSIPALANLTSNGLVRTVGGIGQLIVDTTPYLTTNDLITLSGDVAGTGTTTIAVTVNRIHGVTFQGVAGNVVSFGGGNTPADSGLVAAQLPTAPAAFTTAGRLLQATGPGRALSESNLAASTVCTTTGLCTGYQAALGFTPENVGNKSIDPALGASDLFYPSQNAVKSYVDAATAGLQAALTFGAGLTLTGSTLAVDSTKPGFLSSGPPDLPAGVSRQGTMQVLPDGRLQYTDGANTALRHTGLLIPAPLTVNIDPAVCTADANSGKLTVVGTEIRCAADIGGTGGTGGVTSVFARTGAVTAQAGDYTAAQVTNAADLSAANVFPNIGGQSMRRLLLPGSVSGLLVVQAAGVAGTSTLTLPGGTTDFSVTGGASEVVQQSTLGGAFIVGQLGATDLSNGVLGTGAVVLASALPSGSSLVPLGPAGTLQASTGTGALAAYSGSTCTDPLNPLMSGLTATGAAQCSPAPGVILAAHVLTDRAEASAPNAVNLATRPSGVLRSAVTSGVASVTTLPQPNGDLVGTLGPQEISNTRINPRPASMPDAATLTVDLSGTDVVYVSALSQPTTFLNPTGVAKPGQLLRMQISTVLPQPLSWGTLWQAGVGFPLPTHTSGGSLFDAFWWQYNPVTGGMDLLYNSQLAALTLPTGVVPGDYACPTNIHIDVTQRISGITAGTCGGGGGGGGGASAAGAVGDVQVKAASGLTSDSGKFTQDVVSHWTSVQQLLAGAGTGAMALTDSHGFSHTLRAPSLTANRVAYLPDRDGVVPLTPGGTAGHLVVYASDGVGLVDGGALSAGGNVSNTGTPTAGQVAEWTNATTIQGISTTGSGTYVKATSPTITTPTIAALANLTSNGFVKTAGGTGALAVDSTTYLADTGVQSLGSSTTYTCVRNGVLNHCKMTFTGIGPSTITLGTSGTLQDGDRFLLRLRCNAGVQTIAYASGIVNSAAVSGPTSCPNDATKEVLVGLIYSSDTTSLQIIASTN